MRRELQWEIDLEWRIREQLRENKILVFFFLLYNRDTVQFYLYNCTVAQLQFFLQYLVFTSLDVGFFWAFMLNFSYIWHMAFPMLML